MLKYLQLLAGAHKPPFESRTDFFLFLFFFLIRITSHWGQMVGGVRVSFPPEGLSQSLCSPAGSEKKERDI